MQIRQVELENIKSYARASFTFERGTTAIVGRNGAGKTTILEAIAWALFDVLEYKREDFLRRGAKKGWVRVVFESDLDQRQYVVYRDTGQTYYVYDPLLNVRVVEKRADVLAFIRQHLGIEPGTDIKALFRSAIGVPQGAFTTEFLLAPAQRKAAFDRLLKVEEYRESSDRLLDTAKLVRDRLVEFDKRIEHARGRLAGYADLQREATETARRVEELEGALGEAEREAAAAEERVAYWERAERAKAETQMILQQRLAIHENAGARLAEARQRLVETERAVRRQRETEEDYKAHKRALETISALEAERRERDRIRDESEKLTRESLRVEGEMRLLEERVRSASRAREQLVEIQPEIERQEALERERDRLRDLQTQAEMARGKLPKLDQELQRLRAQHVETRERIRQAEAARRAQDRVREIESERIGVENELAALREALSARQLLEGRWREEQREIEQIESLLNELRAEVRRLEARAIAAAELPALEAKVASIKDEIMRLRASIERDERMEREVKGGLCPILSERCLNLKEGETLEGYFRKNLDLNRARLEALQNELVQLSARLHLAHEAQLAAAQLEKVRQQVAHEEMALSKKRTSLAQLNAEIGKFAHADAQRVKDLQAQLVGLDAELKLKQREAMRFAELDSWKARLREIEENGKRLSEERVEAEAIANGLASVREDLARTEKELADLNDPRGRAKALRAEAEQEEALKREFEEKRNRHLDLMRRSQELKARLRDFATLETRLSEAIAERDRTAESYREYLACSGIAERLPDRLKDLERAESEAAEAQRALDEARRQHERAAAAYDAAAHERARSQLFASRERVAAIRAQLEWQRERASSLKRELDQLDDVRRQMERELQQRERLSRLDEAIEFIRDKLREAGPLVAESYLCNVSLEANHLFREMIGNPDQSLRWSRDYEIILEEDGHERSFQNLSGGEQMAAALAVRLALLKELSDIRLAFFDEPTVNMDAERRERLAQIIGQVRHFDQLFVISHDDTFEQTVDHVVMVEGQNGE
ncbi:MAG: SMC family ATPase [Pyrinomonas methylaliphatogenes]|nr:SMC family ATPase [Pyrinomonas methylaliphatogenes]